MTGWWREGINHPATERREERERERGRERERERDRERGQGGRQSGDDARRKDGTRRIPGKKEKVVSGKGERARAANMRDGEREEEGE